jgi:microsomal dipeptidase-like Zn-dependent dipeptidase
VDFFGADHVFFGTDYPWGPGGGEGRLAKYPGVLQEAMDELSIPKDDREKIKWKNITSLLRL